MKATELEFFEIDPNRLDEEWVEQVSHYHTWAMKLADAKMEYERAKSQEEMVTAEIDQRIRLHPDQFGMEKRTTEDGIKKTIVLQKSYQRAREEVIKAKHTMDQVQGAVNTLDNRKYALQDLVKLRLSDYFAEPAAPKGKQEEVGRMERDAAFRRKGRVKSATD